MCKIGINKNRIKETRKTAGLRYSEIYEEEVTQY